MNGKQVWASTMGLAFGLMMLLFCAGGASAQMFTDVAQQMGLTGIGTAGGVFWYDYDNDGDLDLLHTYRFGGQVTIYRNDGDHFTALTTSIGLPGERDAGKCQPMDFNHDGLLDLWLDQYGTNSQLMMNAGDHFTDQSEQLGLGGLGGGREFGWIDINRDGWLDLMFCDVGGWHVLRNDNGTHFTDITESTQLPQLYDISSFAEGDVDLDGNADLFVTRLGGDDHFYYNLGDGVFEDRTVAAGLANIPANLGCAWVDFDHDKYPDLLTQGTDYHAIWHNNHDGTFTEMNVHGTHTDSWGDFPNGGTYAVADFNEDGLYDFYVSRPGGCGGGYANNQFFVCDSMRDMDIWFHDIAPELGMDYSPDGMASWGDYDGDNHLDLYISVAGQHDHLFHNNAGMRSGMQVQVRGPQGDRDRWLSRVELYPHGSTIPVGTSELNYSNVSRNGYNNYFVVDPNAHYDLKVYYVCGTVMGPDEYPQLSDVVPSQVNHLVTVYMGQQTAVDPTGNDAAPADFRLNAVYPNPFNATTTIGYSVPEASSVRLAVFDVLGRHVTDLVNANVSKGEHRVTWNASNVSSGLYFVRLQAGGRVTQQKALLLK